MKENVKSEITTVIVAVVTGWVLAIAFLISLYMQAMIKKKFLFLNDAKSFVQKKRREGLRAKLVQSNNGFPEVRWEATA